MRVASADAPVPYAPPLEAAFLPSVEKVVAGAKSLVEVLSRADNMATNVVMPQMGESIAEGTIVRWIKKVGETVERDEPLFEISTDKVDAEIPSPAAGVLTEIKVKEGETVPVNRVVAVIGEAGSSAAADRRRPSAVGHCRKPRRSAEHARGRAAVGRRGGTTTAAERQPVSKDDLRRQKSSPLVRRIAREHNVDIQQINGTGISGRVTKSDILDFIESGTTAPARPRRQARPDAAAGPGLPSRRARRDRPDDGHAQEDRRAHGAERAHVAARVLGVRGELRPPGAAAREEEGASTSAPARKLTYTALIAQGRRRRAARVSDRQRLDRRRQHRLQEGHQPRHRGRARQG